MGIARVSTEDERRASFADIDSIDATETMAGAILRTPGYISPEQIRGGLDLDQRADIYALGCILFEILAFEPLHPRGQAALASALTGADARPSVRTPERDIAPELDVICVRATAIDGDERFANARQVSDAVQRFLDGNRTATGRARDPRSEHASGRTPTRERGGHPD